VALLASMTAIAAPVAAALWFARQSAIDDQKREASTIAADLLRRADDTQHQIQADLRALAGAPSPCSPRTVEDMVRLAAASDQLQGLGFVAGDRLVCSSFGPAADGTRVGRPDYVGAGRAEVRSAVTLPDIPRLQFILIGGTSGYTAVVHPDLLIDVFNQDPGVAVGIFGYSAHSLIAHRGDVPHDWVTRLQPGQTVMTARDDQVVAVARSTSGDYGAFAAIPATRIDQALPREALVLVPIALVAGLVLTAAVAAIVRLRIGIPGLLRSGLRRGEFFVEYQPIVDLHSGAWVGAEALLRWRRPDGALIRPDIFIPVAEESGIIVKVTERMLDLVGRDAADFFIRHPDVYLSVNLSAEDLESECTVDLMTQLIERTGARHGSILVEATEHGLLPSDGDRRVLQALRAQGLRLAIDDFGTGYSNLSYLQSFELDVLKIDKVFIDTIGTGAAASHVAPHIVAIAKDLGLEVIAEGVETEAQARYLRDNGVRYAQGWLFSRSIPFAALAAHFDAQAKTKAA
jgi:sensor c-di-GMP phosphodiesterase-like protein